MFHVERQSRFEFQTLELHLPALMTAKRGFLYGS
jgi:hypothetical protein